MDAASGSAEDLEKNAKGAGKGMEDGGKGAKTSDVALGMELQHLELHIHILYM